MLVRPELVAGLSVESMLGFVLFVMYLWQYAIVISCVGVRVFRKFASTVDRIKDNHVRRGLRSRSTRRMHGSVHLMK